MLGAWSVAWGGEVELAVERGWAEYDRERFPEARALARQALEGQPGHPGARGLYVEATAASGWGGVGSLELGGAAAAEPWAEFEAAFAAHVAASDKKAIKADVLQVQTQWPDAPDLLRPLWAADAGPALSARSRWAALARPATWSPEALLRWDRLAGDLDAPGLQAAVDAAIREKDLARPTPLDHFALRALGQEWSEHPLAGPPPVLPSELAVSAGHLDELWTKAARWDELQAFWASATTLADDAHPHERKAAAHLAEGKPAEAATDLDAAFARLGAPRPSDQPALATERIRAEVVRVLRTRAAAARAREDVASARGDLGTAILLGEEQVDGPLADELEHLAVGYELQLEPKYRSRKQTPAELAVGRALALPAPAAGAEAAAVQKAADEQLALAREARFLALSGMGTGKPLATDPEAWREVVGDTWYVEGRAHALAGRHAEARAAFVVASLLLADDAEVWDRRAAEHAALGETDAAFAALAVARGKGAPATEERLAATYRGPGDALTIARAIGGDPPPTPPPARARGTVGAPKGGARAGASPRLGQPFPVDDLGGVSLSSLRGRLVVVSAFRADCEECLQMLPTYSRLASRLRRQAVDLVLVTLATDEDGEAFDRTAALAETWGQLAHDPAMAGKLGIRRYPTTWVVDRTGVTRYFVDHWLSAQELESMIRQTP